MDGMQLAQELKAYSAACENILFMVSMSRPLTLEESALIAYYCGELLAKIDPILAKQASR